MPEGAQDIRRFSVHSRNGESPHARVVEEASFEAAAVAYVEDFGIASADRELSLIVRDLEDGREHCFTIDLETGDAAPCG